MATSPVTQKIGADIAPPSTSLDSNVVTHIFDDTLKSSAEKATRPLVGMSPKIEALMISAKEELVQAQQLPKSEEEQARQTFQKSIDKIQADLDKVYVFAQKAHSTQLKVALFHELTPLFENLYNLYLVWNPGKSFRPALLRYLDCSRQEENLAELTAPVGSEDLYMSIIVKVAAITVNAHYGFYIHRTGYIPHEPHDNIEDRESLIGIYNFLDSSECPLSDEKKVELYDELLEKFVLLNEATIGWMSKPNESDTQYLEKCRQKTASLKPATQSPQENPSLNQEEIHRLTALITQHLCDAEKTHQDHYSTIKWIPKKIRTALDNDKKILSSIYNFVIDGPKYTHLSSRDCRAIVDQLIALFKRINQLVVTWSGKEDKDALNRMSSCKAILMSGRGRFFDEPAPTQKSTPPSEEIPITPSVIRPIKKDPTGGKISVVFQIAAAAILACFVIVAYRHFYTKR